MVDALFGFSFHGSVRAPFDTVLAALRASGAPPIVSVDIPSGWDVEAGDKAGLGLQPAVLVSLSAPKLCAQNFCGRHFLGGRFIPPSLAREFNLDLPEYPGTEQVVELK